MMAASRNSEATPICRCRVLYLGSAVPHVTKDGLQGIQEPLRELYPEQGALGARGIDSWLSVWSNGVLLENVDENHKQVTRFFPIDTLHYCAAVRYVLVPEKSNSNSQPRFLPLDSPFARSPNPNHPPLFACILRRTTGIKVLECHTFICKREMAANALVRCCFHAYADSSYVKNIDNSNAYSTLRKEHGSNNSIDKVDGWRKITPMVEGSTLTLDSALHTTPRNFPFNYNDYSRSNDDISIYNGDENHKVWAGSSRDVYDNEENIYGDYSTNTLRSSRSSRPRQIVSVTPPPPPPLKEEKSRQKKEQQKTKKGRQEEVHGGLLMNGSLMRGGGMPQGTLRVPLLRQGPPPMGRMAPGPPTTVPILRRPQLPPRYHQPNFPPSILLQPGVKMYPLEEPIYMPSHRPMTPVSSYQPCHFPLEAYMMHQYATMNYHHRKPKNAHSSKDNGNWGDRKREENGRDERFSAKNYGTSKESKKEEGSPYNTGIYRRKGHMNERAFSYSIRQEHRSRKYGSLANLKFAGAPGTSDYEPPANKEEMKKEREIIQLMEDLELTGDDIERSQVPANVYQQTQQRNSKARR